MSDELDIEIVQGREPSLPPASVNIVIDVLRAFTTTHVAFRRGCREILLAGTVDEAFSLAERHSDYVLAGERDARKVDGFDVGNSPWKMSRMQLGERGLILTTTNGVKATLNALDADEVLVTGWSNAAATVQYVRENGAASGDKPIHVVASHPVSDEDVACAEYIAGHLDDGEPPSPPEVTGRIRTARSAQKFYSPEFELRDLDLACKPHPTEFAMAVDDKREVPRITRRYLDEYGRGQAARSS